MATPIGIDPASGKATCIWIGDNYSFVRLSVRPQMVRSSLEKLLAENENCVVAWDAPLSFGRGSFSDRRIDSVTRRWVRELIERQLIEKKAVNAMPFSGLSHWVISCESLGYPYGKVLGNLRLYPEKRFDGRSGQHLIEVHPAVALACLWLDQGIIDIFPVYKKSRKARKVIVDTLGLPDPCIESDDILDAYVAYKVAVKFRDNEACSPCLPADGSYVLPDGGAVREIEQRIG